MLWACAAGACLAGCEQMGMNAPRGAESILEVFQPTSPTEAADWFLNSKDDDKRYRGAVLLANAWFVGENPAYLEAFKDYLLTDPDPSIRAVCARGLGNNAGPEYAPALARAMREDDVVEVREEAARALQRIHSTEVVRPLVDASREPDPRLVGRPSEPEAAVRVEAVVALGQYEDPYVVEVLIDALDDSSLVVNRAAIQSLKTLTGQDFGYDAAQWTRWQREASDLFAAGDVYEYPVFTRSKDWWEFIPFVPQPPNETPATPAGTVPQDG